MSMLRIAAAILIPGIFMTACGPTSPMDAEPTPTTQATLSSAAAAGGAADPSNQDEPSPTTSAEQERENESASADCLAGTWQVVPESLVGYRTEAFDQAEQVEFQFQAGADDLLLKFDAAGNASYRAEDLEIQVMIPDLAEFTFLIRGERSAQSTADGWRIATWEHTQVLSSDRAGEAESVIQLTPVKLFAQSSSGLLTLQISGAPADASITSNECVGDNLTLNPDSPRSMRWARMTES